MLNQYHSFDVKHPFKTFITDSNYCGCFNGVTGAIMQSDENVSKLLVAFKEAIENGNNLNEIQDDIYQELNIYPEDLTDDDFNRLQNEIQKMYNRYIKEY